MQFGRRQFLRCTTALAIAGSALSLPKIALAQSLDDRRLLRRYIRVNGRDVFYMRSGKGPPAILLHGSPGDSDFFSEDMPEVGKKYTAFAFDTPGFGRSDPLIEAERDVAFFADTIAAAMRALNLPPSVVYGSHTGAAVAAELGARHPDLVRALVLDGFPMFTAEEDAKWFTDFVPLLVPDKQGGHFASVWTRCRDQSIWFPWSYKEPAHLLNRPAPTAEITQRTAMRIMRCGRTYQRGFRSALLYGPRAVQTLDKINVPTLITCAKGDPLSPHLARLPAPRSNQTIQMVPTGKEVRALRDEWLARYSGTKAVKPAVNDLPTGDDINAHIAELPDGREVFVRVAGKVGRPAIVLIHDAPGSSKMHKPLIRAMAKYARVYALDLPGCGETEPLGSAAPSAGDFAEVVHSTMAALNVSKAVIHGIGFGSAIALELDARFPASVEQLVLQSVALPSGDVRADMLKNYAPLISLKADGTHWYATWLMLRDSLTFWPWYQSASRDSLRRVSRSEAFDADLMHDWTVEVMKQYATYHQMINASLAQDSLQMVRRVQSKTVICTDASHPFANYDDLLVANRSDALSLKLEGDVAANAAKLSSLLGMSVTA